MNIEGIEIKWLGHACFKIKVGEKNIYIDPFKINEKTQDADYILLTHPHYDHCSLEDIGKVVKEGTKIIMQIDCQSKVLRLNTNVDLKSISLGEKLEFEEVKIEATPAYNIGKEFHSKDQEWIGFILTINNKKIYIAGDTDLIPEMDNLPEVDIAFLPVSGTYVMTADEAVESAKKIKSKIYIPMHYASIIGTEEDADKFVELCLSNNLNAKKMNNEQTK